MDRMLAIIILLMLPMGKPALALDGSVSVEMDTDLQARYFSPDFQANVGQVKGDYRFYGVAEFGHETPFFPNNNNHYRLGVEFNQFPNLKIETGLGLYAGSGFSYGKVTYSFDTEKK